MKITFLGTSHGYPEKGRAVSCTMVETGGKIYIIDAGSAVDEHLVEQDADFSAVRAVFITHMHSDHVNGLLSLHEEFLEYRYNDQTVCYLPEDDALDGYLAFAKTIHLDPEKICKTVDFRVTKEGICYRDENIKVRAIPTMHIMHGQYPAFAYEILAENKNVLFTGDMDIGFPEYEQVVGTQKHDLVICEMAHADLKDIKEKLKKTNTSKMLLNHYHYPRLQGFEQIFKEFPFDIQLSTDGLALYL